MLAESDALISEIIQIREQYVAEVGKRRAWPRAIKERIAQLQALGLRPGAIAERTGVPYQTIILWKYKERKLLARKPFHPVAITGQESISKSLSVTPKEIKMPESQRRGLRLTTPQGFAIEGLDARLALELLRELTLVRDVL